MKGNPYSTFSDQTNQNKMRQTFNLDGYSTSDLQFGDFNNNPEDEEQGEQFFGGQGEGSYLAGTGTRHSRVSTNAGTQRLTKKEGIEELQEVYDLYAQQLMDIQSQSPTKR